MSAKTVSVLGCLLSIMTLTSCVNYQQNYSDLSAPSHVYNFDNGHAAEFTIIKDIAFSSADWSQSLAADLYLPKQSPSEANSWPVVLMVHGGGWSGRDRTDMTSTSKKIAKNGYAVFNVSYRFAPQFMYPAPVQDLQLALLWLQNNATQYQLDLHRVNAWGYSSGAHLVAQLASVKPGAAQTLDLLPPLPKIRAVVAGGIPADLSQYSNSPIVVPFLGVKRDENPQLYKEASPMTHISSDDPPMFLYHGKLDRLVEKEQSIHYYNALRKTGVPAELYLDPLWGHFAMFLFGWDAENKAINFLNHYNYSQFERPVMD